MSNPFSDHSLPGPRLSDAEATVLLQERFGRSGDLVSLGSHQDQNWRLTPADETTGERYVLKVSNPGFPASGLDAQNAAMLHLHAGSFPYEVPLPRPDIDGHLVSQWTHDGERLDVRLVTYLDGRPLAAWQYLAPTVLRQQGALAAHSALGLSDFDHPGLDRLLQWDCRHAASVVEALLHHVGDRDLREAVAQAMAAAERTLLPLVDALRVQVVHADATDVNVVARLDPAARPKPTGLIDFGDVSRTWLVSDAAVAAVGSLGHDLAHPLLLVQEVVAGYHDVLALAEEEVDAIWPLVVARAAACVVSSEQQAALEPHNGYAQESRAADEEIMQAVLKVEPRLATAQLRAVLGLPAVTPALPTATHPLVPDLNEVGLAAPAEGPLASPGSPPAGMNQYRRPVLARVLDSADETNTIPLGVQIRAPDSCPVHAPFAATVTSTTPLALGHGDLELVIDGVQSIVHSGAAVAAGDLVGRLQPDATPACLHVQWRPVGTAPPRLTYPALVPGWSQLCPDPGPVVGVGAAPPMADSAALLRRRHRVLADAQEHYYTDPPRIERGWRHHLFDVQGRAYLDMVNNVASVGHSHPRVTDAVSRQLATLNTNSRFNYAVMVDFAERLVDLLPDPLDTVFLVSTGSEAVDLALRIASAASGSRHVLAVQGAYHGWTMATDAVSTSLADNPLASAARPPWVHTVPSPNTFRGEHRGRDAGPRYAADLRRIVEEVTASGSGVCAFVAEALYGNAGGLELPSGYLEESYATVRAAGGVCIADEVQVGYARTGDHFWAFQDHDVVPDIVCAAKAAGNGMAVGAVVTSRAVADAFASQGSFFSSVGGSPVSCAAGLAVLDVIRDEALQENARDVGDHLRQRLRTLVDRHEIVGAVHGKGLYLGVELVRDRGTLEPATRESEAICERMLRLGVVLQPTGDHLNVLKVKPPLCLTQASADFFVDTLDHCLTIGW